jgi:hypothetical protein
MTLDEFRRWAESHPENPPAQKALLLLDFVENLQCEIAACPVPFHDHWVMHRIFELKRELGNETQSTCRTPQECREQVYATLQTEIPSSTA